MNRPPNGDALKGLTPNAKRILESDGFKEAMEWVKEQMSRRYYDQWCSASSEKEREELHARTRVFDDVLRELRVLRDRGAVARHQQGAR